MQHSNPKICECGLCYLQKCDRQAGINCTAGFSVSSGHPTTNASIMLDKHMPVGHLTSNINIKLDMPTGCPSSNVDNELDVPTCNYVFNMIRMLLQLV